MSRGCWWRAASAVATVEEKEVEGDHNDLRDWLLSSFCNTEKSGWCRHDPAVEDRDARRRARLSETDASSRGPAGENPDRSR
jgi:hypothetical protein